MQYVLECISFQLVFLIMYDLWLKKETFFQWNRAYLLGTYIVSLLLPWIKIEALKTAVPEEYYAFPTFLISSDQLPVEMTATGNPLFQLSWQEGLYLAGVFLATLFFGYKLLQIYRLRSRGEILFFHDFTRVVVKNSNMAFSFFRSIFLGDQVLEREHESIIQHELVHIRQRHSLDLLFFETMRILGWFNPLVYVYQSRISELHEFIADAKVAKTHKKEQYQLLLSQVFQTKHISFINQFSTSSLIKKRIVMLTKTKSKKVFRLKYVLLMPVVLAMLMYTSCQPESAPLTSANVIQVEDVNNLTAIEEKSVFSKLQALSESDMEWELRVKDKEGSITFVPSNDGSSVSAPDGTLIRAKMKIENSLTNTEIKEMVPKDAELKYMELLKQKEQLLKSGTDPQSPLMQNLDEQLEALKQLVAENSGSTVPFRVIEQVPIFPGCEGAGDQRACFQEAIQKHISKNFNYPLEAQQKGIQGRVSVMFVVQKDGTIGNIKMRGPDPLLEAETARIIGRLPKMQPGKNKGKAVNVPFSIPITFKLQTNSQVLSAVPLEKDFQDKIDVMVTRYNDLVAEHQRLTDAEPKNDDRILLVERNKNNLKEEIKETLREM